VWVSTIIVAAGSGTRFGGKKQFHLLCNKPVVIWSIDALIKISDELILILPKEDILKFKNKWGKDYPEIKIFSGGKYRYDSVKEGLRHISSDSDYVCIHDGVRPLIKLETIKKCLNSAIKYGAAICAQPAIDTLKLSASKNFILRTIQRKKVWMAQTPQIFRKDIIISAYNKKISQEVTDDAELVEQLGYKIKLVKSDSTNIKITNKQDIIIAEQLLLNNK
jgi:2-C-methyl-D-erythritol 4-phosphate cytidylyltransferase